MKVQYIALQDALPVRHAVLWPDKPLAFCRVDGDESALHFGVYVAGKLGNMRLGPQIFSVDN